MDTLMLLGLPPPPVPPQVGQTPNLRPVVARALGNAISGPIYLELASPYCTQKQKRLKIGQEGPKTPTRAQLGPNMGPKWAQHKPNWCVKTIEDRCLRQVR